ncbi:MAG: uracil-DNA glycosylase [Alphaproteobacteria bacterium]|nr:uracil-DNA glycosylase [Alphaproteobacteria bacterium]
MSNIRKNSLSILNYYKSFGVESHIQNTPRIRFKNYNDQKNQKKTIHGKLTELKKKIINVDCKLKLNSKNFVFYDGILRSDIMIIGEAPGFEEDKVGKPFVGAAGKKLDEMINAIGLDRKNNVYITNIIPWRPTNNRTPTENEINLFLPYVEEHISIISPKILLLFGNVASKSLLNLNEGITKHRGKWFNYNNPFLNKKIFATCIFHPSYLLRSPNKKKFAWEDLKKVKEKITNLKITI